MIANARMYTVTPAIGLAWRELLLAVAARAGVPLAYHEHPAPLPVNALWARADSACVFICGLPFATREPQPQWLAAPVPSPARYGGQPVYFTEFLVREDAPYADLAATAGARLAAMLPESNSGYNAPRWHAMLHLPPREGAAFAAADVPTPTPLSVIEAVRGGQADVGVADSYLLELLRAHAPARLSGLRTLEVTHTSPIPLLMAAPQIDGSYVQALREALASAHRDERCAPLMRELLIERFAGVEPSDYAVLAQQQAEAERRGFQLVPPPR